MSTRETYRPKDYRGPPWTSLPYFRGSVQWKYTTSLASCKRRKSQPPKPQENADEWLNDTEEQMAAEDVAWETTYRRHRDEFLALRETAQAEIDARQTRPMFDEHGNLES